MTDDGYSPFGHPPREDPEALAKRLHRWLEGQAKAPAVAEAARWLEVTPLQIAEAAGQGYWLYLDGDLSKPETATVEQDGE